MLKRWLFVALAIGFALPVAAGAPVVCSATPQSPATTCSETAQSSENCVCAAEDGAVADSSLLTGLVSYWALDEASGPRADSVGSNDLTDNNTVLYQNLGPSGVVADFNAATSEWLGISGSFPAGSYTATFWVYNDGAMAANDGYFKLGSADAYFNGGMAAYADASNSITVEALFDSASVVSSIPLTTGWNLVAVVQDAAGLRVGYSVNGAAVAYGTSNTGAARACDRIFVGRIGTAGTHYSDTQQARVGLWSVIVSDAELATIYNSGKGKSYSDLTTAEKVGLVSYWNLDEASGNRYDSHGSNDLTDNNTVTSVTNSYPANLPGKVASFVTANSESLTVSPDILPTGADWALALWYQDTGVDYGSIVGSYSGPVGMGAFSRNNNTIEVYTPGLVGSIASVSGQWHLLLVWRDNAGGTTYASVDNGTAVSAVVAYTESPTFKLGNSSGANPYTGLLSSGAIWSRVLTADERACLYASGAAAVHPFTGVCN